MAKKYNTVSKNEVDHEASAAFVSALAGPCYCPATEDAALARMDGFTSEAPAVDVADEDRRNWALAQIDDIARLRLLFNCNVEYVRDVPTAVLVAVAERLAQQQQQRPQDDDEQQDDEQDEQDDDEPDYINGYAVWPKQQDDE